MRCYGSICVCGWGSRTACGVSSVRRRVRGVRGTGAQLRDGETGPGSWGSQERFSGVRTREWATHAAECCRVLQYVVVITCRLQIYPETRVTKVLTQQYPAFLQLKLCIGSYIYIYWVLSDIANWNWVCRVITDWSHSKYSSQEKNWSCPSDLE